MPAEATELDIAAAIDHTLLLATATTEQVDLWCETADRYGFAAVCVHPCHVARAVERLHGSRIRVSTVVGFPLGTATTQAKLYEAQQAVDLGATELDVRINPTWAKEGRWDPLHNEIALIVEETGVAIKAILETALLSDEEKRTAGQVCIEAGSSLLMTSTGWASGATVADVRLLWQLSQGRIPVKASGGIRTVEQAIALLEAGASRLGTSFGLELMQQLQAGSQ